MARKSFGINGVALNSAGGVNRIGKGLRSGFSRGEDEKKGIIMTRLLAVGTALFVIAAAGRAPAELFDYDAQLLYGLCSQGEASDGCFGGSVAGAGDVDQDGYPDIIVGASRYYPGWPGGEGCAYIFDGRDGCCLRALESPRGPSGYFGNAVSGVGDMDNDGYADVIVGAWREDIDPETEKAGSAYIFSGQTGDLIRTLVSPNAEPSGHFGSSVAGDASANRASEVTVIVGASGEDYEGPLSGGTIANAGRAYVFCGFRKEPYTLNSPNREEDGAFGTAVAVAGDLNGDGFHDFVVGAPNEDPGSFPADVGMAYVFSGASMELLYSLVQPYNPEYHGRFGCAVAGIGDTNGDGFPDLIVGAHGSGGPNEQGAGMAFILSGPTGELLQILTSPNAEFSGHFGWAVSGLGDIDADGSADVIVSAYVESPGNSPENAGRAYVFSGATGELLFSLASPHQETDGVFGASVAGIADVNKDGLPDAIVGAIFEDPGSSPEFAGRAYVYSFAPPSAPDPKGTGPSALALYGPTPNPTKGSVSLGLRVSNGGSREAKLSLYDAAGRRIDTVLQRTIDAEDNVSLRYSPSADIPSGVYYWRLETDGFTTQKPMVLVR